MPESLRSQNRWRYWTARAREASGDGDAARAEYSAVMSTDNWYAVLSAARLGQRFSPTFQEIELDKRAIDELAREPGFLRTRELLLCDLVSEAGTEWGIAYERLAPAQQVQAIGLADRWAWHHQSIAAAAQQSLYNDYPLLYPRPYDKEVRAAARLTDLPEELIYAVIRQESLYRADAGSSAGALGLMQLLPTTARRAARRWGLKEPARTDLLLPSVNVPVGAAELKSLVDRFDGQTLLATAAYNAGPGAVQRWLPATAMDNDIWVENIPFNETRTYVQRVAWHTLVFEWLDDRRSRDVETWLGRLRLPAPAASNPDRHRPQFSRPQFNSNEEIRSASHCGSARLHGACSTRQRGDGLASAPRRGIRQPPGGAARRNLSERPAAGDGPPHRFRHADRDLRHRRHERAPDHRPRAAAQAARSQLGQRRGAAGRREFRADHGRLHRRHPYTRI